MREKLNRIYLRYRGSSLVRGFIATILGSGTSRVFSVLTTFLVARILSADDFGQFSFVRTTLEMLLSICAVNFSSLCTKFMAESEYSDSSFHKLLNLFLFCFCICVLVGILLIVLPEAILLRVFLNEDIVSIFRITGVILPFLFLSPLLQGVLRGKQKFKLIGYLQTLSTFLFFVCASIGAYYWGVYGALWAVVIYYVICSFIFICPFLSRLMVKNFIWRTSGFSREAATILTVVLPMFAMSFVEAPSLWLAQLMLSHDGGYSAVGAMAVIMQIRNIVMIMPGYFFGTYMAFASKTNASGDYKSYFHQYDTLIKRLSMIAIFATIVLVVMGKTLLSLFGSYYSTEFIPYVFGVMFLPLFIIGSLLRLHMVIRDHQRLLLVMSVSWNIIWLGLFYALCKIEILSPLVSFFISQNAAYLIYFIPLKWIYNRDRRILYHS